MHDEVGDMFHWNGQDVKVKEKIRIESQDPNLISTMTKLTALEREVAKWRTALAVVMGDNDFESD